MLKKAMALLLALLLLPLCPVWAEEAAPIPDHLTVGSTTRLKGDFFTEMWGNDTSDIDVRLLLHDYDLIIWNGVEGMFSVDPSVVSAIVVTENAAGDRSYTLSLYTDLYYSDGTPITAWDYAFSLLLSIAPQIEEIGGRPVRREHLLGYQQYIDGEIDYLPGVHVLGEHLLTVTVRHEYLPFFYEFGLLDICPYPIAEIAPGCQVKDDGQGVYIANIDETLPEPLFTADLLAQTILNPETGYLSHPRVVSGPYTLTGFDGETATFAINPWYKGDYQGDKPTIERLTYTLVENETMLAQLEAGEIDLINKTTQEAAVSEGFRLAGEGSVRLGTYPRVGLSYISFSCEKPAVSSQAVRQAIAWCLDKDSLTQQYIGPYGLRVEGYYGLGQWMYGLVNGTIPYPVEQPEEGEGSEAQAAYEAELAQWEQLSLDGLRRYDLDVAQAVNLLTADGWVLNRAGEPFDPQRDDVRCKLIDSQLVALDLTLAYPAGNRIAEGMQAHLLPHLARAGIRVTLVPQPMTELLQDYYKQQDRQADMTYLASNFAIVFDPAVNFIANDAGAPTWNYTNQADETLYQLALDMRRTEPGSVLEYCQKWVRFQERFSEVLPMLPIYSNIYYDFYTNSLHNYLIAENITWSQAILRAYLASPEDAPEEDGEDEEVFFFDD